MAGTPRQKDSQHYEPAQRQISIDENYSDCDEMSQPSSPNQVTPPDDMDDIQTQLSHLTMTTQGSNEQLHGPTPTQPTSEAVLAATWIHIFEHHHPTQKHVLLPYRDSNERIIRFIRSWFFSELKGFLHLDALVNAISTTMAPRLDVEDPGKEYTSFEQWYGDAEKPPGWIFDGETQSLVLYTHWLASKNLDRQTAGEELSVDVGQIETETETQTQTQTQTDDVEGQDAGLLEQLERMQIEDMVLDELL
ncbi:hypothetical protein SLS60_005747 [Paraconiothyrium brasiliense]|uniref:Uncharacterized protein n=1 Tax=Paraconiothyrium brasiliense TaxID=300254 RepID=A0ABR3RD93_9PLEO